MPLNPPKPGLKPLVHDSNQVTKVELVFQPGDELAVPADVAAQLQAASSHFKPYNAKPEPKVEAPAPVKKAAKKA